MASSRPPVGGSHRGWTVILPLKGGPGAKSRLGGGPDLARAIAEDCLQAVLACPAVRRTLVVTADRDTALWARSAGAQPVAEATPGAGLVAAVHAGLAAAGRRAGPVAVLLGDLPALRPGDLAAGLVAVQAALETYPDAPMAAVPDTEGTGTVLLGARRPADLDPAFGPDSMAEHRLRGAVVLAPDAPRLRRDVDTMDDLYAAVALGVGPRTAALAATVPSGR